MPTDEERLKQLEEEIERIEPAALREREDRNLAASDKSYHYGAHGTSFSRYQQLCEERDSLRERLRPSLPCAVM